MLFAGVIRTSDSRQGSIGEMYANQRHMLFCKEICDMSVILLKSPSPCRKGRLLTDVVTELTT